MQNLTAWLAEMLGPVQMTNSASRTSGPSLRRYAAKPGDCVSLLTPVRFSRWGARIRRFGWRRRTIRQKTLYTMGCTFRRTRGSYSIASTFITTRRSIQTRTHPNFPRRTWLTPQFNRFAFNPERFLGDTLTCAESSKQSNAMDRDHWAFGAG